MCSCLEFLTFRRPRPTPVEPAPSTNVEEGRTFRGRQIRGCLYDLRQQTVENPTATILFIHSIYDDPVQLSTAYWSTWVTRGSGRSECWPGTLLDSSFRVLTMKIDLSARVTDTNGRIDIERMTDNLVTETITHSSEPLGQEEGSPVIVVTHGLGAIVAQRFVLAADERLRSTRHNSRFKKDNKRLETFLENLRGVFYYSPIFAGSEEFNKVMASIKRQGPAAEYVKVLNKFSARDIANFQTVIRKRDIKTMGVAEEHVTRTGGFDGQVVVEGTANIVVDTFVTVAADYFGVCQPENQTSNSFVYLESFIKRILEDL